MNRWSFLLLPLMLGFHMEAQVSHLCPLHSPGGNMYENPLNQKWLSAYDVKFYDLALQVSNTSTEIDGVATLLLEAVREMDTVVLELQDALEVVRVELGENTTDPDFTAVTQYSRYADAIFIPLDRPYAEGELLAIRIEYGGEAGQDRGFFAGITNAKDNTYGFDVTYTLSEPMNAKDWFPVKQVLEDQIDSVQMHLRCHNTLMVASNGTLEEVEPEPDDMHTFHWRTRYPMAYYLISFAVADYQDFSFNAALSGEGDSVLVQNYIYNTSEVFDDWEEEIRQTGPLISTYSELLIDYPFSDEKYGHAMAPMGGGMEHQTMTTLQDFSFFLVAHELAHQWFGDHITCGNWQDIWINEGFASYMEYIAAQELLGQESADSWMDQAMSIALSEKEGSVYVPEEEVEDTYRLFDYGLSYKKGAILLHMIRYHLNDDEVFFDALRSYLDQYGQDLATGEDFREILESSSGMDFSCFFEQWYYGAGYPRFQLNWSQEGDSLMIRSEQTAVTPSVTPFFRTPFDLEIQYMEGDPERIRLMQEVPVLDTAIAVLGAIEEIIFDPDGWLLKSVSVINLIPEYGVEKQYVLGPNPVVGELRIRFQNTPRIENVIITNMAGQEVWSGKELDNPVRMDLSGLSPGTYLLMITDDKRTYRDQIVKVKGPR